ncbi:MAG: peptidase M28 family protein, partial [Bacteroidota bacterium]
MKRTTIIHPLLGLILLSFISCQNTPPSTSPPSPPLDPEDIKTIRAIFDQALEKGQSYEWMRDLCKDIGPRLSGSEGASRAVVWGKELMERLEFDEVYLQDVMVPHWERGLQESAQIVDGDELAVLAIGGSVATPETGVQAPVVEVFSLDEVDELGESVVKGKIVFYNRAFDQRNINTGAGYGGVVDQRSQGASRAAKYGAVAIVMRSASSAFDDVPHTGTLHYEEGQPRIPAGALGVQSAIKL